MFRQCHWVAQFGLDLFALCDMEHQQLPHRVHYGPSAIGKAYRQEVANEQALMASSVGNQGFQSFSAVHTKRFAGNRLILLDEDADSREYSASTSN